MYKKEGRHNELNFCASQLVTEIIAKEGRPCTKCVSE